MSRRNEVTKLLYILETTNLITVKGGNLVEVGANIQAVRNLIESYVIQRELAEARWWAERLDGTPTPRITALEAELAAAREAARPTEEGSAIR